MPAAQLAAGGSGKARGRKPDIHADEKSDARIVPMNDPNNGPPPSRPRRVWREGGQPRGTLNKPPAPRTQSRTRASMGLDGVREAARALRHRARTCGSPRCMHHITPQLLIESFMQLKRTAAAGVDGVTWREYEEGLVDRVGGLWDAVQSGRYRAPAISAGVHPQGGRQTTAAGHRRTGGQDRPASGGDGAQARSTRRTSSGSPMGSGPDAASIKRWMRCGSGSIGSG